MKTNINIFKRIPKDVTQILVGSILGDGCISQYKNGTLVYLYQENHSIEQEEYVRWKAKLLSKFFNVRVNIYKRKKDNRKGFENSKDIITIVINNSKFFKQLKPLFYFDGKKKVDLVIDKLNSLGLAVWYMDDGCYHYKTEECIFSTYCFGYEGNKLFQKMLYDKFGIKSRIELDKRRGYFLVMSQRNSQDFIRLIKPFIIKSMKYKLGLDNEKMEKNKMIRKKIHGKAFKSYKLKFNNRCLDCNKLINKGYFRCKSCASIERWKVRRPKCLKNL